LQIRHLKVVSFNTYSGNEFFSPSVSFLFKLSITADIHTVLTMKSFGEVCLPVVSIVSSKVQLNVQGLRCSTRYIHMYLFSYSVSCSMFNTCI